MVTLVPLGDAAFIVRDVAQAASVARSLNEARIPGLIEAVAAYDTLGLYVDPESFEAEAFRLPPLVETESRPIIEVPTLYDGEDLLAAAEQLGVSTADLIAEHCGCTYTCFAVGFSPGFPYLGYLPDRIATLPRRTVPRVRVPAGSVAIAGRQTGIYPEPRPGGWWLIGRTDLTVVDLERDFFRFQAGDSVRFVPMA